MVPSVYFSFFCLLVSLVSNFHPDTWGVVVVTFFFRLAHSFVLWGGRNTEADTTGVCEECTQCLSHTGFAPLTGVCAFPVYIAQAPGCSAGELSKAGPGLHALPRSKPLRFRFLGTPQGHRLSWACVLCPPRSKQLM